MPVVTIWPRMLLRTRRTWPAPAHSEQVTGEVPSAGAAAVAHGAGHGGAHRHRRGGAEHGLLECQVDAGLEVLARAAGRSGPAAPKPGHAEHALEEVAEAARAAERVEAAAAALRDACLAEAVVARPAGRGRTAPRRPGPPP